MLSKRFSRLGLVPCLSQHCFSPQRDIVNFDETQFIYYFFHELCLSLVLYRKKNIQSKQSSGQIVLTEFKPFPTDTLPGDPLLTEDVKMFHLDSNGMLFPFPFQNHHIFKCSCSHILTLAFFRPFVVLPPQFNIFLAVLTLLVPGLDTTVSSKHVENCCPFEGLTPL